jgi:hypothetical protein
LTAAEPHILVMTTTEKKAVPARRSAQAERNVIYRGIKIAPMTGKRSAIAQAIREGLQTNSGKSRGDPVKT